MAHHVDQEILALLARHGEDGAVPVTLASHPTEHERIRAVIERALEMLLANGLIRAVPREDWPEYVVADPPYALPGESGGMFTRTMFAVPARPDADRLDVVYDSDLGAVATRTTPDGTVTTGTDAPRKEA
jgi:hypothetical protein